MASTPNVKVLPSGHKSAGLIVTDSSIQYTKFQHFLDPEEHEDDLFLGLHPIEEVDWKDNTVVPHEMLLRGIGNGHCISFKYIAAPTPEGSANRMANEIKYTEPRITGPIPALIDLDEGKLVKKL